jgi:serine/threonine-protein kinase HipA
MARVLIDHGAQARADLHELWSRIVFNMLVCNSDDHLRNHGFLYEAAGWRLSPAYDMNPVPADIKPRILSTAIDEEDGTASLELAFAVAAHFGVKPEKAKQIIREVRAAVALWRKTAAATGLSKNEIDRMASAFEHND